MSTSWVPRDGIAAGDEVAWVRQVSPPALPSICRATLDDDSHSLTFLIVKQGRL